ncbi:MAG: hypothetical protein ACK6DZ_09880, partial [Acidobacteriota bacterium]
WFSLTKANTYCKIKQPAPLRSEIVRLRPGMPFAFPPEYSFAFAGIASAGRKSGYSRTEA